jgi:hypothetical protein
MAMNLLVCSLKSVSGESGMSVPLLVEGPPAEAPRQWPAVYNCISEILSKDKTETVVLSLRKAASLLEAGTAIRVWST